MSRACMVVCSSGLDKNKDIWNPASKYSGALTVQTQIFKFN